MKHRAFLKWAGGKFRLTEEISRHLPQGACLVEPFVGAGSVFLNTNFERYLLADANVDLINLFNIIKYNVDKYIEQAKPLFTHPNANSREFYLARRTEFNCSSDAFERSVLFLYLNRFGFNGLCRYNKKKEFNVPFGRYQKHYFPEKELRFFAQKAQNATFLCADFQQTFDYIAQTPDDYVIYCDPPYAPLQQESNFTHYTSGGFYLAEQQALANRAKTANYPVLISNHDTPFTREIYQGSHIYSLQVQRNIGQKIYSRIKVGELLALFK